METALRTLAYQKQGGTEKLIDYAPGDSALYIVNVVETRGVGKTRWTVFNKLSRVRSGASTPPQRFRGSTDPERNKQIILAYIKTKFHLGE